MRNILDVYKYLDKNGLKRLIEKIKNHDYHWTGTHAEYEAQKDNIPAYAILHFTDDYIDGAGITDVVEENNMEAPTSNAVALAIKQLYPVGSVYINVNDVNPATILGFGTWQRVAQNMALWGASANGQGGTTKAAGLPNITGEVNSPVLWTPGTSTGAFFNTPNTNMGHPDQSPPESERYTGASVLFFDASHSSAVYGNSTTVQPPALVINVWQRTA